MAVDPLSRFCFRFLLALALLLGLAGCASLEPMAPGAVARRGEAGIFRIEGRFSLRHEQNSYSGRLAWEHSPLLDQIFLMNPFGQGVAEITRDSAGARLVTADRVVREAADPEALVHEVLGYPLPLAGLAEWLQARAPAGAVVQRDEQGRLASFTHAGWEIDYDYPEASSADTLPWRLHARHGDLLDLKLRIDDWKSE